MPVIIPTHRCDLRCTHCLRAEYSGGYLDPGLLERFLNEFGRHSSQRKAHSFTGGEPTIHKDLDGLLAVFRRTGHSLYIVSNGQNEKGVETVIHNKDVIDYVSISLDAPTAEMNDLTRGPGSFDKAVTHARAYLSHGVEVDFRFVLHDRNADLLESAFALALDVGLTRIRFSTLHPVERGEKHGLEATYDVLLKAYRNLLLLKKKYPRIKAGMNTRHMIPHLGPEWPRELCTPIGGEMNGWALLPDGKISFCCDLVDLGFIEERYSDDNKWLDPIIGDYTKQTLDEIRKNKKRRLSEVKRRRQEDVANGRIKGPRQYICENCKFYHYKKQETSQLQQ
jgi:MoaA/NifB/PqqE/SkfB family radical SAM enzyme